MQLCHRRRNRGTTLIELMIALTVLAMSAVTLTSSYTMSSRASQASQAALAVQSSLQTVYESVADVTYSQLLSWDGVIVDRGDHFVTVGASLVAVGLIQLDFTVTDRRSGLAVARLGTLRSGES